MEKKDPQEIISLLKANDPFGLLDVKHRAKSSTENEIVIQQFEEINEFVDTKGFAPREKAEDTHEFMLFKRFVQIVLSDTFIELLTPYDRHNLLHSKQKSQQSEKSVAKKEKYIKTHIQSVEAKESNKTEQHSENKKSNGLEDPFGLLKGFDNSILKMQHVAEKKKQTRVASEIITKRKRCTNFEKYSSLFKQCQREILQGKKQYSKFEKSQKFKVGEFIIYNRLMCYVESVGPIEKKDGGNTRRLHLIFENGMESYMYSRGLAACIYRDGGFRIVEKVKNQNNVTGYIYVLKSLSTQPEIKNIKDFYKIGFSTTPVEQRIKNASHEATYLMADVEIVASYQVKGISPVFFESIIHKIFDTVQVVIEVVDEKGKKHKPKEWFMVPFPTIHHAIELIQSREISDYVYDQKLQKLVKV